MTKKEKEELERKQKKRNKNKNIAILVLLVLLIACVVFYLYSVGIIKFGEQNTTEPKPSNSVSDTIKDTPNSNDNTDNNNPSTDNVDKPSEDEPSSDIDTSKEEENKNDGSVYSASLPLTDNDALAILNSRYGKGYSINRSTQSGSNTNFAVFKDDERYATVSVNLSTGDATERIIDSGKETKFNLLKGA